jgi:hypothetical protein
MTFGVDPDGDHHGHVDDAALLADLLGHGVERHVGVGATIERSSPESGHLDVELLGHPGDLRLGERLDAEGVHQALDPAGRDAAHVALGHDGDEGPLGPPAGLQQPARVVGAFAQLGDGQIDRPHPGVQGAGSIAVAAVRTLRCHLAVAGVAQHVHLRGHQPLSEAADHLPQQIAALGVEVLAQPLERVHVGEDHRVVSSRNVLQGLP